MAEFSDAISLRQLRALVCVGDTASFTGAADQLGMSQPSVSQLIRRLEAELGQSLVVRGREISLTPQGRALADIARRAILSIDNAVGESREQAALKRGSVSVAIGHVSAATLLPQILIAFNHRYPDLNLVIIDCVVEQIRDKLLSHEADLGIGAVLEQDSRLSTKVLWDSGLSLFVRADHPLVNHKTVDAGVLSELACIQLNPNAPPWRTINRQLIAHDIYPRVEHRVALVTTAIGMIQAGMGAAILPQAVASQMPHGIHSLPIRNPVLSWPISLVRLANYPLSSAAKAFSSIAQEVLARAAKTARAIT